ncbi:ABC-type organic anion transporter ABCA8-like isoform X4 [Phyllobates terribilis]|uniref:ABC-type organic anion transporter ABCA8-like isoform X4 n=1 Tax=Phyllobates terribilis TaxID=111132 RepID=UPI003CCB1FFC
MNQLTRRDPSLWLQTAALLWKNLLLKWRRKWHSVLEWLQHLAFVLILFFLTFILWDTRSIGESPASDLGRLDHLNSSTFIIGYSRESPAARRVLQKLQESDTMPGITIKEFDSEEELMQELRHMGRMYLDRMVAVKFRDEFTYHLRFPSDDVPAPNDYLADRYLCHNVQNCRPAMYWRYGFLALQASIDAAIIELSTNHSVGAAMISTATVKMRSVMVISRPILYIGAYIMGLCMCYISVSYLLTLYIAKERKEHREIMRMMGLQDLAFWLSWGLLYALYVLIIANLMTLVTTSFIFVESSYGVILLLFFLYGISMICFTFMLCALLRRPRLVAIAGFFITLLLSVLSTLPLVKILPVFLEVFLCVFPPFAFSIGITESIHMENGLQGVFFSDIPINSSFLLTSYIGLLLDSILYILLTLYFDKILADKHGLRHEPLFFLRSSYWSRGKKTQVPPDWEDGGRAGVGDYVEKVPAELQGKEAIRINNVKKIYSGKDKKMEALRGLDLDVYEGQITALLGHSGAGKTTLLNILSGMSASTSGSAAIYNHQLSNIQDLEGIQRRIGFCPQSDIKFDQLTVREHLELFSRIKGVAARDVASEVGRILSDLDMTDIQNVAANKLSGGQRRKLTLSIALLGDPEVLLLDEPTAGLDPFSRHHVWAILKERKSHRVTLFSTQFMDEADILADRKAVLSNGRLKCVGSSLFLKRNWGIGYHLRMQVSPSCNPDAITSLVQEHVSSAKLSTQNVEDLTFTLPFHKMDSFPDLFSHLDERVGADIVSYGVSITTLDDVFLKLEGQEEIEKGGASIEDFVNGIKAQDISVKVRDGPYDRDTTGYNGAIELSLQNQSYNFTIIWNPRVQNGLPVLMNIISNAFLNSFQSTKHIETWTTPVYPVENFSSYYLTFMISVIFMFFACGFAPHFAMSSVEDYKIKARSQLRISGLFPSAYWCGQALLDIALYWLLLLLIVAILFAFNYRIPFSFGLVALTILDLLFFGADMVLFVYVIAFIFRKGKVHPDRWSFLFIILGLTFNSLLSALFLADLNGVYILCLFIMPPGNMATLLMYLIFGFFIDNKNVNEIFLYLMVPCVHIVLFWGILWLLEWRFGTRSLRTDPIYRFSQRKHQFKENPEDLEEADEEVLAERERVKSLKGTTNPEEKPTIIVDSLRKEFKDKAGTFTCRKRRMKAAARDVSFCVKKGEVLGLLGPNGAGKTTSVLMLAGELKPTAGEVVLCSGADDSAAFMGYCPQFSPLWPTLTVKEHLEVYAAVKGMKKNDANEAIKRVSDALELKQHLNKPAKKLSAGVSRKVCFAISMLGNPTIALLDEPSTGLDPKGQQRLWRALRAAFRNKERGAILTTHYMEEAEAVCDHVAIMVSGKLRCIGSIQQLKSKFGKGYLLEMKVKDSQRVDEIHQEISRIFPQADRQDRFSSLLCYKIPMDNVQSLSQAFTQLEKAKRIYDIEEYSFSQPTLEQVFLDLAKEQERDDFDQDAMFKWRPLKSESV